MCTRFVYNGKDTITGFNFDIDLSVWDHNTGTLLYVHGNPRGRYVEGNSSYTIADLTENYIRGILSFDEVLHILQEQKQYSLMTNYSVLKPESTRPYIVPGDDRYEQAQAQLEKQKETFSVSDAFHILKSVRQEGLWATRVTFVYSVMEKKIYYVLNNDFEEMSEYSFDS